MQSTSSDGMNVVSTHSPVYLLTVFDKLMRILSDLAVFVEFLLCYCYKVIFCKVYSFVSFTNYLSGGPIELTGGFTFNLILWFLVFKGYSCRLDVDLQHCLSIVYRLYI